MLALAIAGVMRGGQRYSMIKLGEGTDPLQNYIEKARQPRLLTTGCKRAGCGGTSLSSFRSLSIARIFLIRCAGRVEYYLRVLPFNGGFK